MSKPINWFAFGNVLEGYGIAIAMVSLDWTEPNFVVGMVLITLGLAVEYGPGKRLKFTKQEKEGA